MAGTAPGVWQVGATLQPLWVAWVSQGSLNSLNHIHNSSCRGKEEVRGEGDKADTRIEREGNRGARKRENKKVEERKKALTVHLMYNGLKPKVVFFYALHGQTTCEHSDINRYEKGVCG